MPYEPKQDEQPGERTNAGRPPSERERERPRAGEKRHDHEGDKPEPARHPGMDGDVVGR